MRLQVHTAQPLISVLADAANGMFGLLPDGDVYFVKPANTASCRIEVFTPKAASRYATAGIGGATRFTWTTGRTAPEWCEVARRQPP